MNNISTVISNPNYIYYNEKSKGLKFYKKLIEPVCVVVQLVDKCELYVAIVYPVTERKIPNRKYKESNDNYVITENEFNDGNKDTSLVG